MAERSIAITFVIRVIIQGLFIGAMIVTNIEKYYLINNTTRHCTKKKVIHSSVLKFNTLTISRVSLSMVQINEP